MYLFHLRSKMLILSLIIIFVFLHIIKFTSSQEFIFDSELNMLRVPKKCYHICKQGSCLYENCNTAVFCPGGACHFINCNNASCSGIKLNL